MIFLSNSDNYISQLFSSILHFVSIFTLLYFTYNLLTLLRIKYMIKVEK